MQRTPDSAAAPRHAPDGSQPSPSLKSTLSPAQSAGPHYWYWQAYRTWVPYSSEVSAALEQSFTTTRQVVDIGGGRAIKFRNAGDGHVTRRPDAVVGLQFVVRQPEFHREVARLLAPAQAPESTLRHMTYATLELLDESSA